MIYFIYIILFLLILILALLFINFWVILSYEKKELTIKLKWCGLSFTIPIDKMSKEKAPKVEDSKAQKNVENEENEENVMAKFLNMRNNFNRYKNQIIKALNYLQRKVHITDVGIIGEFGTGNAATTGIAYGSVQVFIGVLTGFISKYFTIEKPPIVNINLNFNEPVFKMKFACVINGKLYHLLRAFLIFIYKK